jgi:DNA-binding response OmpR family regulator
MPRVLLIDDEPRVSRALAYAFGDRDIELQSLTSAEGLDTIVAEGGPDVILLDIALGANDGISVCRRIRADARFRDVPILLLSGQTDAATKRAGLEAGADDFVSKPFVPDELLARIDAQLRRRERA